MWQRLLGARKDDICPNCGTACFATDVLCPNCGKNLDELYEHLPPGWPGSQSIMALDPNLKFLLGWVGGTAIGMALGQVFIYAAVTRLVDSTLPRIGWEWISFAILLASELVTGVTIGLPQWLALRSFLPNSRAWLLLTPLGTASGIIVERLFNTAASHFLRSDVVHVIWPVYGYLILLLGGLVLGLCQWLVLTRLIEVSWQWVIATATGWALAWVVINDVLPPLFYPQIPGVLASYGLTALSESIIYGTGGIVLGLVTGVTMIWLLRHNVVGPAASGAM